MMDKPQTMKEWTEVPMAINGHVLSTGQAMTVRVALETMSMSLTEDGTPEIGTIEWNYLERIRDLRKVMGYGN